MLPISQNLTTVNYNSANKTNKYIVVHYTGNSTDTAYNNTKYFKSVNRNASAHYFVDDNSIWQCVQDKDIAWHCGDSLKSGNGGTYYNKCTNRNSIGIEMCCTNYDVSKTTENNTVELVKYLMNKYSIPASNVIRHYDVTNKNCPAPMVKSQDRWNNFKKAIGGSYKPTPVTPTKPTCTGDIHYRTYDGVKKQYLPTVVNDSDYAGNKGHPIQGFKGYCENGNLYMRTHTLGKPKTQWEETVVLNKSNFNSSSPNAYAGIIGKDTDCVQVWSDYGYILYRSSPVGKDYYPWVDSRNRNSGKSNAYAGSYGIPMDRFQMK